MSSVDPLNSSLYFTAAAQAVRNNQARKREDQDKKAAQVKRVFFDLVTEAQQEQQAEILEADIPIEIANMPYEKAVQVLLDSVYSSGDLLKNSPDMETILEYKKNVQNFMRFVVKNSYQLEKHTSAKTLKKRLNFYTIEIIDKKLDQLAAGVLYNQRDQMRLLARIEEINGMLVDLLT